MEVHESVQETAEELTSQKEGSAEPLIKNGPENCSSHEEDPKDENLVKVHSTLYRNRICSEFLIFSLLIIIIIMPFHYQNPYVCIRTEVTDRRVP
jgi:hypothetical protein